MNNPTAALQARSPLLEEEKWLWRIMLAPAVIYIAALVGFPFLLAIYYSLSDATVGSQTLHFVGFRNFQRILENSTFWISLRNALVFTIVSQLLWWSSAKFWRWHCTRISAANGWCAF